MPSDERPARRGADLTLTAGVLVAVFASLLPLMRVVRPSSWLLGAIVLSVAILAAGFIARRYRLPALAVTLIEASVWVAFMMLVFLRDTALLWVIPTPETVRALPGLLESRRRGDRPRGRSPGCQPRALDADRRRHGAADDRRGPRRPHRADAAPGRHRTHRRLADPVDRGARRGRRHGVRASRRRHPVPDAHRHALPRRADRSGSHTNGGGARDRARDRRDRRRRRSGGGSDAPPAGRCAPVRARWAPAPGSTRPSSSATTCGDLARSRS